MKLFHHFTSNAVPLLARILLCLAFVPSGWHHAMEWTEFQGAQAERLRTLGVTSALTATSGELVVHQEQSAAPPPATPSASEFTSVLQARSLHELTLQFDGKGVPEPTIAAWIVSVFELIGGGLLLVGLFSRIWAVGVAFWAIALFGLAGLPGSAWGDLWTSTVPARASMLSLVAIATLALGIAFNGAGAFSLDAMIFRRGGKASPEKAAGH